MYGENLPTWILAIYYLFFLATFVVATNCMIKMRMVIASVITIVLLFVVQVVSILYGIDRASDHNELEHFLFSIGQGEKWSIFVAAGHLYIVVWWIIYLRKIQENRSPAKVSNRS
ncbi:hypothetical protein [Sutcliffiella horikoshii]|uniref:hypothetical protein n=1 Tax=Sutcliffiella horikoshii TaxID=79883 RepID=UPI00384F4AD0